jgi:hypothetical protein
MSRTERAARELLRARSAALLAGLGALGALLALVGKWAEPGTVATLVGLVSVLFVLARIAITNHLLHTKQLEVMTDLQELRQIAEADLAADQKQNVKLEQLLKAMRNFNVIQVEALEELRDAKPATWYYLESHTEAISDVLNGAWKRRESLRPEQLWTEYADLLAKLRPGEEFRSTVVLPEDPIALLQNTKFADYAEKIYEAARSKQIAVKRIFVLDVPSSPPRREELPDAVLAHLRELQRIEQETPSLSVKVTTKSKAVMTFREYPDFMIWGNHLLIESNLDGPDGLVVKAIFYFAGTQDGQISERRKNFDDLFERDPEVIGLDQLLGKATRSGRRSKAKR